MRSKKHNPEQIVKKLREGDAMLAAEKTLGQVCQALEISEQTRTKSNNSWRGCTNWRVIARVTVIVS
jgi:hypothetical protein